MDRTSMLYPFGPVDRINWFNTFNMRGPSYLGLTRSISWLPMTWLVASSGHQQPWYWLCRIGRYVSYLRKDFNYLCHIFVEKWHKCKYMFLLKNLAHKGLHKLYMLFPNEISIILITDLVACDHYTRMAFEMPRVKCREICNKFPSCKTCFSSGSISMVTFLKMYTSWNIINNKP